MYQFSAETVAVLKKSGWSEDRHVDITDHKKYLSETKQPLSDIILEFLTSFGGMEVTSYNKSLPQFAYDVFLIEPRQVDPDSLRRYAETWIMKPLCGVGMADNELFAMTPQGESYVMFDTYVAKIGNTVEEAVETLCTQGPREQIHKPRI